MQKQHLLCLLQRRGSRVTQSKAPEAGMSVTQRMQLQLWPRMRGSHGFHSAHHGQCVSSAGTTLSWPPAAPSNLRDHSLITCISSLFCLSNRDVCVFHDCGTACLGAISLLQHKNLGSDFSNEWQLQICCISFFSGRYTSVLVLHNFLLKNTFSSSLSNRKDKGKCLSAQENINVHLSILMNYCSWTAKEIRAFF